MLEVVREIAHVDRQLTSELALAMPLSLHELAYVLETVLVPALQNSFPVRPLVLHLPRVQGVVCH